MHFICGNCSFIVDDRAYNEKQMSKTVMYRVHSSTCTVNIDISTYRVFLEAVSLVYFSWCSCSYSAYLMYRLRNIVCLIIDSFELTKAFDFYMKMEKAGRCVAKIEL